MRKRFNKILHRRRTETCGKNQSLFTLHWDVQADILNRISKIPCIELVLTPEAPPRNVYSSIEQKLVGKAKFIHPLLEYGGGISPPPFHGRSPDALFLFESGWRNVGSSCRSIG
jgi:hypothetical protein